MVWLSAKLISKLQHLQNVKTHVAAKHYEFNTMNLTPHTAQTLQNIPLVSHPIMHWTQTSLSALRNNLGELQKHALKNQFKKHQPTRNVRWSNILLFQMPSAKWWKTSCCGRYVLCGRSHGTLFTQVKKSFYAIGTAHSRNNVKCILFEHVKLSANGLTLSPGS